MVRRHTIPRSVYILYNNTAYLYWFHDKMRRFICDAGSVLWILNVWQFFNSIVCLILHILSKKKVLRQKNTCRLLATVWKISLLINFSKKVWKDNNKLLLLLLLHEGHARWSLAREVGHVYERVSFLFTIKTTLSQPCGASLVFFSSSLFFSYIPIFFFPRISWYT